MSKATYGSWKSPISSALITESAVGLQQVTLDQDPEYTDFVYWVEARATENGRNALCSYNTKSKEIATLTPADMNVRTTVHEYGGNSYVVYQNDVFFVNFSDQVLYVQKNGSGDPVALSQKGQGQRFADFSFSAKYGNIYCVRESHEDGKEAVNCIVSVSPSSGKQSVLASGADFYSDPKVSPDGKQICWIQWNHPNMPWDSTSLYVAELNSSGDGLVENSIKRVETGEDNSIIEPRWNNQNELFYISDQSDWWNLYRLNSSGQSTNLLPRNVEIGGPKWQLGGAAYAFDPNDVNQIITLYAGVLEILDLQTSSTNVIETGFDRHRNIRWSKNNHVYCLAYSATQFISVVDINISNNEVEILKESKSLSIDRSYFSLPEAITWTTEDGQTSHGFYYPPQNKDYIGRDGELPPLLVRAHGGPTAAYDSLLDLKLQYFTSRGFAVLLVNYRGSTGYGKKYRHSLKGQWGIFDVDDCCSGALYLAQQKKVDSNKLCIDGGSAGGYTTLACLTFKQVFQTGVSHYGVADVEVLAAETHKFESRYMDTLVAPYNTDEGRIILKQRSPINYVDQINCGMAFFQGDEDKVVPPNQAEMMYKAVKEKGKPAVLVMFKGEQHGFRKAQNVQDALDGEFYFFSRVLGFKPADTNFTMKIENLD